MAKGGERRMLFDIRGRRRHVVRVVYAILALLMGTSLFLVVGPFNLGELVGSGGPTSAAEALDEQAERIEGRLKASPDDEKLLLSLSRARINAGNAQLETNPQTGLPIVTTEAHSEYELGVKAWRRYLEQTDEPNPAAAAIVARTYFSLAEGSRSFAEIGENVTSAAETQALVAKARPSVGALSTLAIYKYFDGDFAAGDKANEQAQQLVPSKAEAKSIESQLTAYRQRAKQFDKQAREFAKSQKGQGKEAFESALGGLSLGGASTLGQ
jgi:hypothetical protein